MGHICLKSSWEGWAGFALPNQCRSNKTYIHYYIVMMGIKDEDEDGIHSHMLLSKKKRGGFHSLVSRIESLPISHQEGIKNPFVFLIEHQGCISLFI